MLELAGYIRISRVGEREGEAYISPHVQKEAIERYAAELGGRIAEWHKDEDFSGGTIDRPAFEAAIGSLERRELDGIVVYNVDRFARSVPHGVRIAREIVNRGQVFASAQERIDPRSPEGSFTLTAFFANGELFLDRIKAGWNVSKARAVARGVHIGPKPIGYTAEKSQPLTPHPTFGPAMTSLFRQAASGATLADLARFMTEKAPRETGQPWQGTEIKRWLQNRIYLGEVRYGDLVNAEAHEPLTDPETFEAAQPGQSRPRRPNGRPFLLSGLVRCSCCRYAMGGHANGGTNHKTPIYRCGRKSTRACPESSIITAERLDGFVLGTVRDHLEGMRLEAVASGDDLEKLEADLAEAETELAAFSADTSARRRLGAEAWDVAFNARADERDAARAARDRAFVSNQSLVRAQGFDDLDHDALRSLLQGMIQHIFVRRRPRGAIVDDRVLIVWSDDPQVIDVPGPHRSALFEPIEW